MLEESASEEIASSIWAFINTPTALFVLLNLMILTIFFTSTFSLSKNHNLIPKSPPQSLLQRIKSIDFNQRPNPEDSDTLQQSHYFFQENLEISHSQQPPQYNVSDQNNPQQTPTHLVFEQKDSNFEDFQQARDGDEEEKLLIDEQSMTDTHFSRTKSDTQPAFGEFPTKLPARMRKSASLKSAFGHFEEEEVVVEARRPATVRVTGNAKVTGGDEEVDAKADDFINRFKQQLKLQRLDSIIRYKDMIGRATGGGGG